MHPSTILTHLFTNVVIIPYLFHIVLRTVLNIFPRKSNSVQGSETDFGLIANFAPVTLLLGLPAALLRSLRALASSFSSKYMTGNRCNLYIALQAKEEISLWQMSGEYVQPNRSVLHTKYSSETATSHAKQQ